MHIFLFQFLCDIKLLFDLDFIFDWRKLLRLFAWNCFVIQNFFSKFIAGILFWCHSPCTIAWVLRLFFFKDRLSSCTGVPCNGNILLKNSAFLKNHKKNEKLGKRQRLKLNNNTKRKTVNKYQIKCLWISIAQWNEFKKSVVFFLLYRTYFLLDSKWLCQTLTHKIKVRHIWRKKWLYMKYQLFFIVVGILKYDSFPLKPKKMGIL